jgi:hypothetical protein
LQGASLKNKIMSDYSQQNSAPLAQASPFGVGPGNIVSAQAYHDEQPANGNYQGQAFNGDDELPSLAVDQDAQKQETSVQKQSGGDFQGESKISQGITPGNNLGNNNEQTKEEYTATIHSMPHRGAPAEVSTDLSAPVPPLPDMPLKRSAKKMVIVSLVVLVILGGAGIFAYDALFRNVAPPPQQPPADPLPLVDNPPQGTIPPAGVEGTQPRQKTKEIKLKRNSCLRISLEKRSGERRW